MLIKSICGGRKATNEMNLKNIERHLALFGVAFLYGTNYSAVKQVTPEYLSPFGFIVWRVLLASAAFWLMSIGSGQKIDWKADGWRMVLCAVFGVGINMLLFFKGLSLTTAIHGSIIMTLTPLMIFGLSLVLLKEPFVLRKVIGLFIGLAGAFLIIYQPGALSDDGHWLGDLMIFINALSYGAYLVLAKPLLIKYPPITLTKWFFLFGLVFVLPFGFQEAISVSWHLFRWPQWTSFFYVIFGVTVVAYLTNIWAMKTVNPSTVGVYIYLQPVFATLIATIFFEEQFSLLNALAGLLVFLGVWLVIGKSVLAKGVTGRQDDHR